ncbi:MAG: hypothetical protein ACYC27_17240 [Armatimonadota bacterium]
MRRLLFVLMALLLTASVAYAAGDQAYLGIFAETSVTKMPGMPEMPQMSEEDMEALKDMPNMPNMPNIQAMMGFGAPKKSLTVRLWSPGLAPKDAFAYITPPAGLKQGKKLDLELYRPAPAKSVEDGKGDKPTKNEKIDKFTIKIYWGSSEKVRAGQPKIFSSDNLAPEMKSKMKEEMSKASTGDIYFYKPDWTTGYWPTKKQPGNIAKDASLLGNFALTTNYTGNIAIDVPQNVNFLAPIDLSSPKLDKAPALDTFIPFKWKTIPNITGFFAQAVGVQGENTLILWSSSEIETEMGIQWDYLEMAKVAEYVKTKIFMKGDQTAVTIPEKIFKDCDMVMFNMIGYGTGTALAKGQPLPRVQTKTTLSVSPLGGKQMQDMMSGMEEDDSSDEEMDE